MVPSPLNDKLTSRIEVELLKVTLAIHIGFIGIFLLDKIGGIKIPIIRGFITAIYLFFVPGALLLGILKLRWRNSGEMILYSIGLSTAFTMFLGLIIDIVLPIFSIKPFSEIPLSVVFICSITFLLIICYFKGEKRLFDINIKQLFSHSTLFLFILLLVALTGSLVMCFYNTNILLLCLLVIVAVIPFLIEYDYITENFYPLAIFIITLSILYHYTLSTEYLWGADIQFEYYNANIVRMNSCWNPLYPANKVNAVLSIVMLAPIYSIMSNVNLTWTFKLVYPFLFSITPLCLYYIVQRQINKRIAFYSSFLFLSLRVFFTEMTSLARQQIAELFLALIVLLMISKEGRNLKTTLLLIIFSFSLVVSHYGISYILMLLLPLIYGLLHFTSRKERDKYDNSLTPTFIALFVTFGISWYIYVSSGSTFNEIVKLGEHIAQSMSELFQPTRNSPLYWLTMEFSLTYEVLKILNITIMLSATIGFLKVIIDRLIKFKTLPLKQSDNIKNEYIALSLAFLLGCLISIALPALTDAASIGFSRFYHLSFFFLAPFSILGLLLIFKGILKAPKTTCFKLIAVFLMIFSLINSNLIAEVIQDHSTDISISRVRVLKSGSDLNKVQLFSIYIPKQDVVSAKWLSENRDRVYRVYSDNFRLYTVLTSYGMMREELSKERLWRMLPNQAYSMKIEKSSYIYLGWMNYQLGLMTRGYEWGKTLELILFLENENETSKIYSNSGSVIFFN